MNETRQTETDLEAVWSPDRQEGHASWTGYLFISVIALAVTIASGWPKFQEWWNFLR